MRATAFLPSSDTRVQIQMLCSKNSAWKHAAGAESSESEQESRPAGRAVRARSALQTEERVYARVVAVADAAAGIKTFTFAWPEGAGRTSRPRPFTYQPGMYASFDFQARTVSGGKCCCID